MLRATFLGWQGWLFESGRSRFLVDPLLADAVGRGAPRTQTSFHFWPPRRHRWSLMPRIDAVVFSHEHEDHFNIPSLARLDRAVPVFLSARSSRACRIIIKEMGFDLRLLHPNETILFGDLEFRVFTPHHLDVENTDEWDTLGYLIRHSGGAGSFFSNVDIAVTLDMEAAIREASEPKRNPDGSMTPAIHTGVFRQMKLDLWRPEQWNSQKQEEMHRPPAEIGFQLNPSQALERLLKGEAFRPVAGQRLVFRNGKVAAVEPRAEFLYALPEEEWPRQPPFWPASGLDLEPVTGTRSFPESRLPELERGLAALAEYLYGRILFRWLYSLSSRELQGRKPTFVWLLPVGTDLEAYTYEYEPMACRFVPVDLDEGYKNTYVGVLTCWAADLMALFHGGFEPRVLVKGWREEWHPSCGFSFLMTVIWPFFHPLRHPEICLRQYRSALAAETDTQPKIFWSGNRFQ